MNWWRYTPSEYFIPVFDDFINTVPDGIIDIFDDYDLEWLCAREQLWAISEGPADPV